MADDTTYKKISQADTTEQVDWLEKWKLPIAFPDLKSKEAYKGLIRIYISTWLSMYNTFRKEGETFELREFSEQPGGQQGFGLKVRLSPPVRRGHHMENGEPRTHLIPPPPPPPPDGSLD